MNYATKYIGSKVEVIVDRPLGSKHPKYDWIYPINYGYIPNTIAPDGKEVDAYILGETKPLEKFVGTCVAVIKRKDDDDDKLVVVALNNNLSDDQIKKETEFQEKFFNSIIVRNS